MGSVVSLPFPPSVSSKGRTDFIPPVHRRVYLCPSLSPSVGDKVCLVSRVRRQAQHLGCQEQTSLVDTLKSPTHQDWGPFKILNTLV